MNENALLKNEILRLNKILDILINQVAILTKENALLKSGHVIKTVSDDMPENMDGIKTSKMPMSENMDGIKSSDIPMSENMDGIKPSDMPMSENMDSIKTGFYDIPEIEQRIKSIVYGMPQNAPPPKPAQTPVRKVAPLHIETDIDAIATVAMHLRKVFHVSASEGKLNNVARELLYLHNHGKGLGHDLRREAGLSKPGFAKHLPTLHRHGLIERGEKKFYHLTGFSKALMDKIFGE
ncbi:MAG TPA: hypothetical protein VI757_13200 [Bacteroidia bacterium]|nr:hypothetical protein [Bacteroidia bacterium]